MNYDYESNLLIRFAPINALRFARFSREVTHSNLPSRFSDGSPLSFLDGEVRPSSWAYYPRSEQVDRIPFFTSPCPSRVATWGRKKEREGWAFSRFWHSRPPRGRPARAISSVVERAPDNCVVVPGLWGLSATWIVQCAHQRLTRRCGSSKAH